MPPPCSDVEAATLAPNGSPPITRITLPTCRAHYPGGSSGCSCRLLPRSRGLPQMAGGSASALSLSRPAQASLALRPAGSLSCPRQPLSRGSNPCGYPHEPLVSYQINRQLSGWILPPLMIRAFGAHCQQQTFNGERGARCLAEVTVLAPGQLLGEAPQRAVHNPPVAAKAPSVKNVDLRSAHERPLEARVLRRYARDEPETRR
jgi:hypothetical protein